MQSNRLTYCLLGVAALFALAALFGHPLISPDHALAFGLTPMLFGETAGAGVAEVMELITKQGKAWEAFKEANDARLKAIEEKGYAPADLTEKVDKINIDLAAIGKSMTELEKKAGRPEPGKEDATPEQAEYRKAFKGYLRGSVDQAELKAIQAKAMNSQTDTAGGYLVLPEMDAAIDRIAPTISAVYRLANVVTIGTSKYEKLVKTAGMSMRRIADGSAGGETTEPTYAKLAIEVFTAEVEPWVNQETLDDTIVDLEADLAMEAGIGFAEGAGAEFITGNGVGKARGIAAYTGIANASYAWGKIGYIVSGKSASFASSAPADKLIDLQHALKQQYRAGAVFLMNDATLGSVRQMKDGSGAYYLWQPDTTAGFGGRLLGSPVQIDDNVADIGAGSYSIAFGNFKRGYTIVNRQGTTLLRDPYTGKGVVKFNFRRRFGGGITNFEAIKLMKFATS